jgi:hypothetical protein
LSGARGWRSRSNPSGYAFIEAFNPRRHVGNLLVGNLHLTGSTAQIVKVTFTNASSGKSVALSISLISLLITRLDVSATVQVAYARAFTMAPTACSASSSWADRCGFTLNTTFLTVPVNANGFLSS